MFSEYDESGIVCVLGMQWLSSALYDRNGLNPAMITLSECSGCGNGLNPVT